MLYRKINCKDRLPEKERAEYSTDIGTLFFSEKEWWDEFQEFPSWWLEPITLPTDEDAVNWIIQNVLRGLSPEKQKEVTKFLLSRGMYDKPTDEEIEKMAIDVMKQGLGHFNVHGFIEGFTSALKYMEGK